ncbi:MAG: nascent polypeptide-associated complex protein [Nanoarchaeota archaeon]
MNINPRQMQQAMRRMGIQQVDIEATEVIIRTPTKQMLFQSPQVAKINMMGQESFQVIGTPIVSDLDASPSIDEDDIATVAEQAGVSKKEAEQTIKDANGDLAEAILRLKKE